MTSNFLIFTSKNQGGLVRPAAVPLSPIPRGPRPHRKNNAVFQPWFTHTKGTFAPTKMSYEGKFPFVYSPTLNSKNHVNYNCLSK